MSLDDNIMMSLNDNIMMSLDDSGFAFSPAEQRASIPPPPPGFTAKNKAAVTSSVVTSQQWPGQPAATRPGQRREQGTYGKY